MSLDQSLKISGGLAKHRNVLSRAERIAKLTEEGRFDPETSEPTGLPKVISRKVATAKKSPKKEKDEDE
ncbi:MAG: small basic protein [Phycisphaeraceae bacterium]|nr:small basic protein [Phycisphaeraceae bacterium]